MTEPGGSGSGGGPAAGAVSEIGAHFDRLTPFQRHVNMSRIRSSDTSLEKALRSQLFRFGFRFRKNDRRLKGSPDIVFPHYRAVIFVNGCFWHAHGWSPEGRPAAGERCEKFRLPRSNTPFWEAKFSRNKARDERDIAELLAGGWRVGIVWECSITGRGRAQKVRSVAERISLWLEEGFSEPLRSF